jgi:hypothetical protein
MTDPIIYSAVLTAIAASMFGILVSMIVLRRVLLQRATPRPAVAMLLVSLFGVSVAHLVEQVWGRVFRLSYDRVLDVGHFAAVYGAVWNVTSSKVIFAMSLSVAAAVQLGLYCDREDDVVFRWALAAGLSTLGLWWGLSAALDYWI